MNVLATGSVIQMGDAAGAFRIDEAGGSFACKEIYLRPTNGRADDQVRRNHATQYFSYPGYDFDGCVVKRPLATSPMRMSSRHNGPGSASNCPAAGLIFL
jgi:hypothetical protein